MVHLGLRDVGRCAIFKANSRQSAILAGKYWLVSATASQALLWVKRLVEL